MGLDSFIMLNDSRKIDLDKCHLLLDAIEYYHGYANLEEIELTKKDLSKIIGYVRKAKLKSRIQYYENGKYHVYFGDTKFGFVKNRSGLLTLLKYCYIMSRKGVKITYNCWY